MMNLDFSQEYSYSFHPFSISSNWNNVDPFVLFTAPVYKTVKDDMKQIYRFAALVSSLLEQIQKEARSCQALCLWLDCDREGENIAFEVIDCVKRVNSGIRIVHILSPTTPLPLTGTSALLRLDSERHLPGNSHTDASRREPSQGCGCATGNRSANRMCVHPVPDAPHSQSRAGRRFCRILWSLPVSHARLRRRALSTANREWHRRIDSSEELRPRTLLVHPGQHSRSGSHRPHPKSGETQLGAQSRVRPARRRHAVQPHCGREGRYCHQVCPSSSPPPLE